MALSDATVRDYDVILTRDQRIVVAQSLYAFKPLPPKFRQYEDWVWRTPSSPGKRLEILQSRDAVRWERLCGDVAESGGFEIRDVAEETVDPGTRQIHVKLVDGRWPYMGLRLIERPIGQLNAFFSKCISPHHPQEGPFVSWSSDGRKWTLPEILSSSRTDGFSEVEIHGALPSEVKWSAPLPREEVTRPPEDMLSGSTWSRGVHPRWGVIYAWTRPRSPWMFQNIRLGPFLALRPQKSRGQP